MTHHLSNLRQGAALVGAQCPAPIHPHLSPFFVYFEWFVVKALQPFPTSLFLIFPELIFKTVTESYPK